MVTTSGGSAKSLSLNVGDKTKIKVNAATKKTYKISSVKVSSNKLRAAVNTAGTVVTIRGLKATPEGKKAAAKVSFTVKKTGKTSKYTYTSKVTVTEEKAALTAEVTGVKTIVATLSKAPADASAVKVAVKKGTADRQSTFTIDGTKITISMAAKLIAGDYTVTVSGVETEDLTATVNVAKNETLTSFYIGENLIQDTANASSGAIYYAALNQYGEKMNANTPTVNCTFGTVGNVTAATADKNGKIPVSEIPSILCIKGTTGTVVLVDSNTGVSTTGTVTFSDPATASEIEVAGIYNANKSSLQDITEKDQISNYKLLMTIKDQYGNELEAKDLAKVSATIAGGLTNVEVAANGAGDGVSPTYFTDQIVDGKSYVALSFKDAYAVAGSFTLTIVNSNKGLLLTQSFDVAKYVVIKSMSISADNGLYNNQDNELVYNIVDADGNNVTSYAVLTSTTEVINKGQFKNVRWEKNADGTAKLIAHPNYTGFNSETNTKETTIGTFTMSANTNTSSDYLVNTFTMTISEDRVVEGMTGLDSSIKTSVAKTAGKTIEVKYDKLVYADQYGGTVTKDDSIFPQKIAKSVLSGDVYSNEGTVASGCSIYMADNDYFTLTVASDKATFTTRGSAGSATVYLKYFTTSDDKTDADVAKNAASPSNYDKKVILTALDTSGVDVSTLKIDSILDGYAKYTATGDAVTLNTSDIKVTAKMGGQDITIPAEQVAIKGYENNVITDNEDATGTKEKTAKVTVVVSTYDSNNLETATTLTGEFKISTKAKEISKIYDVSATKTLPSVQKSTTSTKYVLGADQFAQLFVYDDQYGNNDAAGGISADDAVTTANYGADALKGVTYTLNVVDGTTKDITTSGEGTHSAQVYFTAAGEYTIKVTATLNGTSKTQTATVVVTD
jgi:hypothetical protein